jgi:hypothetical protein
MGMGEEVLEIDEMENKGKGTSWNDLEAQCTSSRKYLEFLAWC